MILLPERIDRQLLATHDPGQRAELLAEKACYLARTGDFATSKAIAEDLRKHFGDGRNVRVSVWLMLLEGVTLYYESVKPASRDRVARARGIAQAFDLRHLASLAGVWHAHIAFNDYRFELVSESLLNALKEAPESWNDVWSRGAMVIADAYQSVGDAAAATSWYDRSRAHARAGGDQATVGAAMYNRAVFRIAFVRVSRHMGGSVEEHSFALEALELESAFRFQIGTNVSALSHTVDVGRARIAICLGHFERAVHLLELLLKQLSHLEHRSNTSGLTLDLAWCYYKLQRSQDSFDIVNSVQSADIKALDSDDRVVALSIMECVCGASSQLADGSLIGEALAAARIDHSSVIGHLNGILSRLEIDLKPRCD